MDQTIPAGITRADLGLPSTSFGMNGLDENLPSASKRKASHFDTSPIRKKPRWSLSPKSSTVPGRLATSPNSGIPNLAHQHTISTWKGKEKAIDGDPSSDGMTDILSSCRPSLPLLPNSLPKDIRSRPKFHMHKFKQARFSASSGSLNPSRAGLLSNRQRRHSSFVTSTQQDPITISSDSEPEGNKKTTVLPKKIMSKKLLGTEASQTDIIDLTVDDDEVEVIEVKRLNPNYPQRMGLRRCRIRISAPSLGKSGKILKLDTPSDDENSNSEDISTDVAPPTTLPTPPKSENDEPASSVPMRPDKQQWKKNRSPRDIQLKASASQSLPDTIADIIDLCSDDDEVEKPGEVGSHSIPVVKETCHDIRHVLDGSPIPQSPQQSAVGPIYPPPSETIRLESDELVKGLVDPIAEMSIEPARNTPEEDEVIKDVMPQDERPVKDEENLVDTSVLAIGTSSEAISKREEINDAPFAREATYDMATDNPAEVFQDNEPVSRRATLVKEPDFSKISTEATEPVPDYDDRLVAAIKWPAEKLPTELHDMINRLPPNYLYNPHMKHIFEAMIEENTAEDEPRAPKIQIIGRKNGGVTPPWEFYYTNRIVYGEGVPRSDKKLLQGCDCIGPCDPKSKTCACVQRQTAWTGGEIKGFLYKKERLMHPYHPVFECNDACECSDECVNRVVQHGRKHHISIALTKNKGWGVFAEERIPRGTYLGIYSGEMILEAEADERGKLYDQFGRTYLFDVDFYHLRSLNGQHKDDKGTDEERINLYTIDAFHVGNFTRFLNHSCDPNCQITATYVNEPDVHKPALTIFTSRDVQKGEELTFAYFGEPDDDEVSEGELNDNTVKVAAGPSTHKQQAVHRRCLCGASNCRGQMF